MTASCVLVTGGAGFVGSHACKALARAGYRPVVYDDLSNGIPGAVRWGPLEPGSLFDRDRLAAVVAEHRPVGVLHFAAFIEAGASVREPVRFYRNNVAGTLALLDVMEGAGLDALVVSSTAAVYGEPRSTPIAEDHPLEPINPYGRSKLAVETILADAAGAGGPRYAALRYFNAAGADPEGELGENHDPETHLIPLVVDAAAGAGPPVTVFGTDYPTADGTCVRDYVHVADLADAHVLALQRLLAGGEPLVANLGTGQGASVRAILAAAERGLRTPVPTRFAERRPGDPAVLVAAGERARRELGWSPRFTDIETIVRHAAHAARARREGVFAEASPGA